MSGLRHGRAIATVTGALVALATWGTALTGCGAAPAGLADPSETWPVAQPAGPPPVEPVVLASDPTWHATQLVEDRAGGVWSLWCAESGGGQVRVAAPDNSVTVYPMEGISTATSRCETSRLAVTDDGAVWASLGYRVWRVDPAAGDATAAVTSWEFPVDEPTALPGATDWAGTWITALAADGDGVLVTRLNLPALQRVSVGAGISSGPTLAEPVRDASQLAWTSTSDLVQGGLDGRVAQWDRRANVVTWTVDTGTYSLALGSATGLGTDPIGTGDGIETMNEQVTALLVTADGRRCYLIRGGGTRWIRAS